MSRTVRRKTKKIRVQSWVLWDWDGYRLVHGKDYHNPKSKEGKKAIAKYHSDAGIGDLWFKSHSGWMRKAENKKHSKKCERALHRFFSGLEEDCILPTYKHDWLD